MTEPGETNPKDESVPELHCFTLGPFETNCYIVSLKPPAARADLPADTTARHCWIVDASFQPRPLIQYVREHRLEPQALILTHAHVDHIAGVGEVVAAFFAPSSARLPVWIHRDESAWLNDPILNLSAMTGMPVTAPGPDRLLQHGDSLSLGASTWSVLHTPGHSPGGMCLHHAPSATLIGGDTLFSGSIGRTDFPGSDHDTLVKSIRSRLYVLPPGTRVHPGHGPATTIDRERRTNPFVRG